MVENDSELDVEHVRWLINAAISRYIVNTNRRVFKKRIAPMVAKRYVLPFSATLTNGFDFQHGVSY